MNRERLFNGRALKIVFERMIEITADLSKFPEVLLPPSEGEDDRREIGSFSEKTDCGEERVVNCIFSSYSLRGFLSLIRINRHSVDPPRMIDQEIYDNVKINLLFLYAWHTHVICFVVGRELIALRMFAQFAKRCERYCKTGRPSCTKLLPQLSLTILG